MFAGWCQPVGHVKWAIFSHNGAVSVALRVGPRLSAATAFSVVIGVVLLLVDVVITAPAARASESSTANFPTDTTVSATLARTSGTTTIQIPSDTTVSGIRGTLEFEDAYEDTKVRLSVGGTTVATFDASAGGSQQIDVSDISAGLTTVASDGTASVVIGLDYEENSFETTELGCRILPPDLTVTLTDPTLGLTGGGTAISTVAEFMSGPAQEVIVVSGSEDAETRSAALSAVAAAAHVWSNADVHVVSTLPEDLTPAYPDSIRVIQIGDGTGDSAQRVGVTPQGIPLLTLSGSGRAAAAAALGDERVAVADASSTNDLQSSTSTVDATSQSLADLGTSTLRLSGPGTSSTTVTVAQSSFGGPISSLSAQLVGAFSALPDQIVATVNIYWNDDLVDSFVLDGSVDVDRTITIGKTRLKSSNSLRIELSTSTADTSACADDLRQIPVKFDVDTGASVLTATRGQALSAGFSRFPQALGGHLDVAFDSGVDTDSSLQLAGQIVAALQDQDTDQISIAEITSDAARSSASAVLIVGATSETADALSAPLRLAEFRVVGSSDDSLSVQVGQTYSTLEAFEQGGRDVLLAGGWAPQDTDQSQLSSLTSDLATWIRQATWGWSSLSDDLLLAGPTGVTNFDSGAVVPQQQAVDDYNSVARWTVAAVALLVIALAVGEVVRRRRVRDAAAAYVAQESSTDEPLDSDSARGSDGGGPGGGGTSNK